MSRKYKNITFYNEQLSFNTEQELYLIQYDELALR